ncbi:hypothetical protein B6U81_05955 [Thermoplasmatales archaeon ex4484_30]|nr:MAG: hypothetical protein B6U81_05955 [Thermoplasmatales archaeon ex4484_30]
MKRQYTFFIKDILDAIEKIEEFVAGMNYVEFIKDDKTTSAVVRKLEVIGEAAKNIPQDVREKYPEVPWKEMAKIRDRLIHGYFVVDHEIIWNVIKGELPLLKPKIKDILERE